MIDVEALQDANFNWQAALNLAKSSQLVYKAGDDVKKAMTQTNGFDTCEFLDSNDTQLFVASKGDHTIISFRGTASVTDWIRNFDARMTNKPSYGKIHAGFYSAYQFIKDDLMAILNGLPDTQKIWVTGHSLGGALASICIAELASSKKDQIMGCYTYGQPRVGNRSFRIFITENYGDRFFRVVNNNDIVPRVPPFYKHVGFLIRFDADGALLTSPPPNSTSNFERLIESGSAQESLIGDEFDESFAEPDPLTLEEFESLQQDLENGVEMNLDHVEEEDAEELFGIADHSLKEYIRKIDIQIKKLDEDGDEMEVSEEDENSLGGSS